MKWAVPGNPDIPRAREEAYMQQVLPVLQKHPAVFRYVWFTARNHLGTVDPGCLLEWNISTPTLTSTGTIYKRFADATPP